MGTWDGGEGVISLLTLGPPADWKELVQVHDDRDVFPASLVDLPVIDIRSLRRGPLPHCGLPMRFAVLRPVFADAYIELRRSPHHGRGTTKTSHLYAVALVD